MIQLGSFATAVTGYVPGEPGIDISTRLPFIVLTATHPGPGALTTRLEYAYAKMSSDVSGVWRVPASNAVDVIEAAPVESSGGRAWSPATSNASNSPFVAGPVSVTANAPLPGDTPCE
jgi:hypothetical protein